MESFLCYIVCVLLTWKLCLYCCNPILLTTHWFSVLVAMVAIVLFVLCLIKSSQGHVSRTSQYVIWVWIRFSVFYLLVIYRSFLRFHVSTSLETHVCSTFKLSVVLDFTINFLGSLYFSLRNLSTLITYTITTAWH